MDILELILLVVLLVSAAVIIVAVLLQKSNEDGLSGSIAGGAETFLSKNKAKSLDAKLAKMTKWVAFTFMILALIVSLV